MHGIGSYACNERGGGEVWNECEGPRSRSSSMDQPTSVKVLETEESGVDRLRENDRWRGRLELENGGVSEQSEDRLDWLLLLSVWLERLG